MDSERSSLDAEIEVFLAAAVQGDESGFTGLYRTLAGRVAGYVRSRGVDDVDDVVNEVFLGAFRNLRTFDGDAARFRSWLFGIAWNKTSDWHRAAARRPPLVDDSAALINLVEGGNAEQEAIRHLSVNDIDDLLSGLTDDQRDVLLLRLVAGLSLTEAADVVGKPVGAVKSLQHRALAALERKIYGEAVPPATTGTNTGTR